MPATIPAVPFVPIPQVVNVPGSQGLAGPGSFTTTTADFVVPATGSTVTVNVISSIWMVIGELVLVGQGIGSTLANPGPATFKVSAIPSTTTVTLTAQGFIGDVSSGTTISAGSVASALGGLTTTPQGVYVIATGTAYTLTTSVAAITFGTTSPNITIGPAGTYALFGRARYDYVGATITTQSATTKLRRTNNTPADISNSTTTILLRVVTTDNTTAAIIMTPPVYYTASAGDIIALWGGLSGATGAGSVQCLEASILAIRVI